MKTIAVIPGRPNSIHLAELPMPRVEDVPGGRGVLVKVLRVGVDGTDKEINAAEYGAAPDGYDFLAIGHESFGEVVEVGRARSVAPSNARSASRRSAASGAIFRARSIMLSPRCARSACCWSRPAWSRRGSSRPTRSSGA